MDSLPHITKHTSSRKQRATLTSSSSKAIVFFPKNEFPRYDSNSLQKLELFSTSLVFTIVVLIGLVVVADAAKKHRKGRKDACHLKEVEHCIEKVQNLGKRKEPSVLIASSDGLNTICK